MISNHGNGASEKQELEVIVSLEQPGISWLKRTQVPVDAIDTFRLVNGATIGVIDLAYLNPNLRNDYLKRIGGRF